MERETRVLVVDDNASVRAFVCAVLRARGFRVLQSDCGGGALKILREDSVPVDLVLTDIVMPGMNGPDLARNVAALSPLLPVLFMTGFTDGNFGVPYGATVLHKPFSISDLLSAVERAISPGRAATP